MRVAIRLSLRELDALAKFIAERPALLEITSQDVGDGDIIRVQRMVFMPGVGWAYDGPLFDISGYEEW